MSQKVLLTSKEIHIILHRLACQLLENHLDFSFSGLKTAVLYHCQGQDMKGQNRVPAIPSRVAR